MSTTPLFAPRSVRGSATVPPRSGVFVQDVECAVRADELEAGDELRPGVTVAAVIRHPENGTVDVRSVEHDHDGPVAGFWDHFQADDVVEVTRTVTVTVHIGDHLLKPRRCSNVPHDPALCHDGCDPF